MFLHPHGAQPIAVQEIQQPRQATRGAARKHMADGQHAPRPTCHSYTPMPGRWNLRRGGPPTLCPRSAPACLKWWAHQGSNLGPAD